MQLIVICMICRLKLENREILVSDYFEVFHPFLFFLITFNIFTEYNHPAY